MPCYLFTYHAFGTWMPDRSRGYVKRNHGILAPDAAMATRYRSAMKETVVEFDDAIQVMILNSILESRDKQAFELYSMATDPSHVHILVGWRDARTWLRMRSGIKSSMSRRLNHDRGKRTWFAEGGSRKRVKDEAHFEHLVKKYLPSHRGWKWSAERGNYR